MPHAIANTTTVLITVAKFELTPSISTFARIEVSAAKIADRNAKTTRIMLPSYAFSILNLVSCYLHDLELAEIAKDSVKTTCSTFLNALCVLSVLRGFILINRKARRERKDFCKDYLFNFPQCPLRTLRS